MKPSNEYFLNAINIEQNNNTINDRKRNEQPIELFINNEYTGLYSLSYNPDIKLKPRNK